VARGLREDGAPRARVRRVRSARRGVGKRIVAVGGALVFEVSLGELKWIRLCC
jgi:hypothetical protein